MTKREHEESGQLCRLVNAEDRAQVNERVIASKGEPGEPRTCVCVCIRAILGPIKKPLPRTGNFRVAFLLHQPNRLP